MITDPNLLFARAHQAFAAGRFAEVESLLESISRLADPHASILHLRALTARRMGQREAARTWFEQALGLEPNDPEILNNYGNLLLDLGDLDAARGAYDRALEARPAFADAQVNRAAAFQKMERHEEALADLDAALKMEPSNPRIYSMRGSSLLSLGRLAEASGAFEAALEIDPKRPTAIVGRATVALRQGEAGAVSLCRQAAVARPNDPQVILKLAEAMEAAGDPGALATMEALANTNPHWAEGQATLARMRWEAGEDRGFVRGLLEALEVTPKESALWEVLARSLGAADLHDEAADAAARGQRAVAGNAELALLEALHASEAGDLDRADAAFARVPPGFPGGRSAEARHRLRTGEIEQAQRLLSEALAQSPWDVTAWALQGVVWRLTGDERNEWLHDRPGFVSEHRLDLDAEQIEAIAGLLRSLHRTRAHPIGQSLRGGTQTRGRLFERCDPEIRSLHSAIEAVIQSHWESLPPSDGRHPLLRLRDRPPRIEGSWSVRLTGGGFHVAHVHPEGLLSSASYLVVPGSAGSGEGWLEVGGPPPELGLELGPLKAFEPKPGHLVLFPSTMFHGTRPFGEGERLTVAFDVVAG